MNNVRDLLENPEFQRRILETYAGFGSGGGGDDDMWQQSVENRLGSLDTRLEALRGDINSDFRWSWSGLAAAVVILAGMMISGYLLIDSRLQDISSAVTDLTARPPASSASE